MKAIKYEGPFKVTVQEVPLPKIEHPDDAIIKVTTAGLSPPFPNHEKHTDSLLLAICGSDLHMYQGPLFYFLHALVQLDLTVFKAEPRRRVVSSLVFHSKPSIRRFFSQTCLTRLECRP